MGLSHDNSPEKTFNMLSILKLCCLILLLDIMSA